MNKGILYVIFAIIATATNLIAQEVSFQLYASEYQLELGILIGTLVGLLTKYQLDKKYIFNFKSSDSTKSMRTFFLYSVMGVFTTVIFWVTEYAFDFWFASRTMRYAGGAIGLAIGYGVKYRLDKKYVFVE